jgi:phage terminase large subunit-like protein
MVAEKNYGGAMVEHVIKTQQKDDSGNHLTVNYGGVDATRGKVIRAEPFSSLYEQGKVRHVGRFDELEVELTAFSTMGYLGDKSPNRADAWIWVLTELFPGLIRRQARLEEQKKRYESNSVTNYSMGG